MKKFKLWRKLVLLVSLVALIFSTTQTTLAFIVTQSDTLFNTFIPFEGIISDLMIDKTVEHPLGEDYEIPENIAFDFKVELGAFYAGSKIETTEGEYTADEAGAFTVSVKPGTILGIKGIDTGTKITVTELEKDGDGFTVKDGVATKDATVSDEAGVTVAFVNLYEPTAAEATNLLVTGEKLLESRKWRDGDTFTYLLEQKDAEGVWKPLGKETITYNAEDESFNQFDFNEIVQALVFDKVGVHEFRMTEEIGELENTVYDRTVNHFTVEVTDEDMDGKLEVKAVSATENGTVTYDEEKDQYHVHVIFSDTAVPAVDVTVAVDKTVKDTGELSIGPEGFEFVLENVTTGEKKSGKTDAEGDLSFGLSFTAEDIGKTYQYKLSEVDTGKEGVTYSDKVYNISVAISLDADDRLVATVAMDDIVTSNCVAEFENIYDADEVPPTGIHFNQIFWITMMIISGAACVLLLVTGKRKKLED